MPDPYLEGFQGELDYLVQTLRWLAPCTTNVEGLAYEVFLALQPAEPGEGGPTPLRRHLFGAAYELCRLQPGRPEGAQLSLPAADIGGRERPSANVEDPFSLLQAALESIPLQRRAVLILHDIDGLCVADVARTLKMSRLAVRWRLARARRTFGEAVRDLCAKRVGMTHALGSNADLAELLAAGQVIPCEPEQVRTRLLARASAAIEARSDLADAGVARVPARAFYLALAACVAFALGEAAAAVILSRGN